MAVYILKDKKVVETLKALMRRNVYKAAEMQLRFSEVIKEHFAHDDDFQKSMMTRYSFLVRGPRFIFEATFVTPDGKSNFVNVTYSRAPGELVADQL